MIPVAIPTGLVVEFCEKETRVIPVSLGTINISCIQICRVGNGIENVLEKDENGVSCVDAVKKAVSLSMLDLRLQLISNIVLIGSKNEKDFMEKLKLNLSDSLSKQAKQVSNPFKDNLTWCGAAMFGTNLSIKNAGLDVLTKDVFEKNGFSTREELGQLN